MKTTKTKTFLRKTRKRFRVASKDSRNGKWFRLSGINEETLEDAHQKLLDCIHETPPKWRSPAYEIVETTMKSVLKVSLDETEIAPRGNTDSISLGDLMR